MSKSEPREELARIAASLRAYLEWQVDCGSSGIPRRPRGDPSATTSTTVPTATPTTLGGEDPTLLRAVGPTNHAPAARAALSETSEVLLPPIQLSTETPSTPQAPANVPHAMLQARPLPLIQAEVSSCTKCGLHATRSNTVFSRGNPKAKLCFVGEAPGADEDAQGVPFVGRAGQLLDKMIGAMGLDPERDVYVCNIIKCRPPGNRRPEPIETETCIPYLHEQLSAVDPSVIVALGNTSVAALLGTKLGITKLRGAWKLYRGKILVMPTYHPSYLLRPSAQQAEAKRQAWEDLQTVMKELGLTKKAPT